jgi:hypothetical protein
MFLGLPGSRPDPFVTSTDPDPASNLSVSNKVLNNSPPPLRIWAHIVTKSLLVSQERRHFFVTPWPSESGSGSGFQDYGSAHPDPKEIFTRSTTCIADP